MDYTIVLGEYYVFTVLVHNKAANTSRDGMPNVFQFHKTVQKVVFVDCIAEFFTPAPPPPGPGVVVNVTAFTANGTDESNDFRVGAWLAVGGGGVIMI